MPDAEANAEIELWAEGVGESFVLCFNECAKAQDAAANAIASSGDCDFLHITDDTGHEVWIYARSLRAVVLRV